MSHNALYDSPGYTGPTFKRLTDEERDRVGRKVWALRDRTLHRPDLQEVFELCDGVLFSVMAERIDVAVVPRLKALFDDHEISEAPYVGER